MAVDFDQAGGSGHTCIWKATAVVSSLPFTFACFFKSEQFAITKALINVSAFFGDGDRFVLQLTGGDQADGGSVVATVSDFIISESSVASTFAFDQWHHAAARFVGSANDPTAITAFLDGVAGPTNTNPSNRTPDGLQRTTIGGLGPTNTSSFGFQGCLANAVIYDIALTDEQIADLASGTDPLTIEPDHLVAYFKLLNEATALVDEIGAGWSLTEFGAGIGTCIDSPDEPDPVETGEADECGAEDEADAIAPCDVEWPKCDLVPTRIQADVFAPSVSPGRTFSGIEQIVQPDAGHWRITYHEIPIRTKARALQWRQIENALRGRNGTVCVPVYAAKLSSTPIVATAADDFGIGETRIGISQTAGATIRAGMHFSPGERLHRITRIVSTEGAVSEVTISPPLREAISADDALDFNTPLCRCRLERDDSTDAQLDLLRFSRPSVTFVEDV